MKRRPQRAWPRAIVEIGSDRVDPRADPMATQKISREQLEQALGRTKSGTRPATRSRPAIEEGAGEAAGRESLAEPRDDSRDDAPQITIVRIDSMEVETIDPSTLPAPSSSPSSASQALSPPSPLTPLTSLTSGAAQDASLEPSPGTNVRRRSLSLAQRLRISPRTAFVAGVAFAVLFVLVAVAAFIAGRVTVH